MASHYMGTAGAIAAGGIALAFSLWGHHSTPPDSTIKAPPPPPSRAPSPSGVVAPSGVLVNPAGFFQYGFPGPIYDVEYKREFISSFDRRLRNPAWVVEHITPESIAYQDGIDRGKSVFKEDENIPEKFRARLRDYFRSGYDRGHQAPAANARFSQDAMDETFYLTNIAPQVGDGFNRDYWAHLENFCRRLTKEYHDVRIVTGPLYLPRQYPDGKWRVSYEVIGNPPNIAVPTHFFKIIVAENPLKSSKSNNHTAAVGAFVLPNAPIPNDTKLTDFSMPIEAIERSSGLELLSKLPTSSKRDLCTQVECSLVIRDFTNALPPPKPRLALPAPP